jgi:hypothetical protein
MGLLDFLGDGPCVQESPWTLEVAKKIAKCKSPQSQNHWPDLLAKGIGQIIVGQGGQASKKCLDAWLAGRTLNEFNNCQRCVVSIAKSSLEDSQVSTLTILEPGTQIGQNLLSRQAMVQGAINGRKSICCGALCPLCHQTLNKRPDFLGLRQGGHDALFLDQADRQTVQQRFTLVCCAVKFAMRLIVPHNRSP